MLSRLMLALLLLATPALAQKPAPGPAPGAAPLALLARMPAQLAGMQRGAMTDFAVTANDPRLGASLGYRSAQGAIGTVYLYNAGRGDVSGNRELQDEQRLSMLNDVRNAAAQRGFSVAAEQAASVQGMRCTLFGLRNAAGAVTETAACLGTHRGLLLKLRYTAAPSAQGMLVENLTYFVRAARDGLD